MGFDKLMRFCYRKSMEKWSEQVKVCSGTMVETGPLSDGYSWRKYGQKEILGANHPRLELTFISFQFQFQFQFHFNYKW